MELKVNFNFTYPIILTIIFVILKVFKIINWAWYWIISPIWIMWILIMITFIIFKIKGWL